MSHDPEPTDAPARGEAPLDRREMLRLSALGGAAALGAGPPLRRHSIAPLEGAYQASAFVNVKDFGAVGNGAHDDTRFIQDAMNAVTGFDPATTAGLSTAQSGGGMLFF